MGPAEKKAFCLTLKHAQDAIKKDWVKADNQ